MKKVFKVFIMLSIILALSITAYMHSYAKNPYFIMKVISVNGTITTNKTGTVVNGGLKFPVDIPIALTPKPNSGYSFSYWILNNSDKYNYKNIVITSDEDFTIEAVFVKTSCSLKIDKSGNGTVSGGTSGTYSIGKSFTLSATPGSDSTFSGWFVKGVKVSSDKTYTFILKDDTSILATFNLKEQPVSNTSGSTVSNTTPASNNTTPSGSNTTNNTPPPIVKKYKISVSSSIENGGSVSGSGEYNENTTVTISAVAAQYYQFVNWTGDVANAAKPTTDVLVNGNKTITANFSKIKYTMEVEKAGAGSGVIGSYNPSYDALSEITLIATPDSRNTFEGWYNGMLKVSSDQSYTFTIKDNTKLQAKFEPKSKDVTAKVQLLGNPFKKAAYARNVWDMQIFNGSIYLGHGNSSNSGPASNAGPIDVIKYDFTANQFTTEYTVNEEQIDTYKIINGKLTIPGHDSRESWDFGNVYTLDNNTWTKSRTMQNAIHILDIASYNNTLYAATGTNALYEISYSTDNGSTWKALVPPSEPFSTIGCRAYSLFNFKGKLYASATFVNVQSDINSLLCVDGNNTSVIYVDGKSMFPDTAFKKAKIVNPTMIGDKLVYIGGEIDNDIQHIPFAMYVSSEVGKAQKVVFNDSTAVPYDMLVRGSSVYVLTSTKVSANSYKNSVYKSDDLNTWNEVLYFNSDTFARSFEESNGDFYFGLGCDTTYMPESTGNILKIGSSDY
jgi:Listeria-Bacteroides repeat domain (List_Bact_rpt).